MPIVRATKDWCWSWNSNTLDTWFKEMTHWKSPWCWERLRAGEGGDREWDGWMAPLTQWTWVTISRSLPKFMSIASVMPSSHLILWCPLLLPSIFPSIRDFSNESAIHIRWPKYWSFSILPMNIHGWFPLRLIGLISLRFTGLSGVFSSTTVRSHQFFGALPSLQSSSHYCTWPLGRP